ncbi:unnamed protein product [Pleuronectes platessa]|uniref:Uncharacterized protein n=1 Tax=Pleuronectes platessa TaxID=8262 RepID=A0A9N7Z368_PLEPL|nr:unnamed protein product [Pleuronectes platessa]
MFCWLDLTSQARSGSRPRHRSHGEPSEAPVKRATGRVTDWQTGSAQCRKSISGTSNSEAILRSLGPQNQGPCPGSGLPDETGEVGRSTGR